MEDNLVRLLCRGARQDGALVFLYREVKDNVAGIVSKTVLINVCDDSSRRQDIYPVFVGLNPASGECAGHEAKPCPSIPTSDDYPLKVFMTFKCARADTDILCDKTEGA